MANLDPNVIIWLIIAIIQILPVTVSAVYSVRAHMSAKRTEALGRQIEVATNSMKDALVKATGDAKLAEGRELGRQEGASTAATLAQGRLSEKEENPHSQPRG